MSYLDTPGIDVLFPDRVLSGTPQTIEEPKDKMPLEVLREVPERETFIIVTSPQKELPASVEWNGIADVKRDKEGIAKNRDWILQDADKRWAPGPGEYSPYSKISAKDTAVMVAQLRKKNEFQESSWVRFAMAELERTEARCAVPSAFEGAIYPEKGGTIYVGLPRE